MQLVRTTVRLTPLLKQTAELKAIEQHTTFQEVLTRALELYFKVESQQKAKKILFKARNIGTPLDALTREDIYAD